MLVFVLDALAQIGFGGTNGADIGGKIADNLLVGALHHDLGLNGALEGDAFGGVQDHGVREADVDGQHVVVHLGAITGAHQLQGLLEAFGHTVHHVGHQRAVQTVHGLMGLGIAGPGQGQHVAFLVQLDDGVHLLAQGALGALDGDEVVFVNVHRHACGDRNRKFTDSRHFTYLLSVIRFTRCSRELRRQGFPCGQRGRSSGPWRC